MERGFGTAFLLLPTFAALGGHFLSIKLGSFAVYGFRQLLLLLLLASCCRPRPSLSRLHPATRSALMAMLFWTGWALVSMLWAPDFTGAISGLLYVCLALAVVAVVNWHAFCRTAVLDKLCSGWTLSLIPLWLITFAEFLAGRRLFGVEIKRNTLDAKGFLFATFHNANDFSGFLILTVPFVLMFVFRPWETGRKNRSLLWLSLLVPIPFIIYLNGSRIAMIGLGAEIALVYWVVGEYKNSRFARELALLLKVIMGFIVVELSWSVLYSGGLQLLTEIDTGYSAGVRLNLILNGLWMLWDSLFLGVGAGGFRVANASGVVPFFTRRITDPHCFLIEILAQFGLPVFFAFFYSIFSVCLKKHLGMNEVQRRLLFYARVAAAGFFFSSFSNASLLSNPMIWTFVASFVALTACFYDLGKKG